jgi:hypothetical protein
LAAVGAMAQTTNDLFDAMIQGRKLAQQLCEARPTENLTNTGVLKIKDGKGRRSEILVKCIVAVTPTNWQSIYEAMYTNDSETLKVTHPNFKTDQLEMDFPGSDRKGYTAVGLSNAQLGSPNLYAFTGHRIQQGSIANELETQIKDHLIPFAGSDFWQCDLGLEFFHWPQQKLLKKEVKRSRGCTVLGSTNPNPSTNGYSRVVSWIDNESGGIVQAEAYDFKNKLLKEFAPKSFKKVNSQWELQEMEIRNVQTGSRTRLEFDLKKE